MAHSPRFKVYTAKGDYIASVTEPDYGAMLIASACLGAGATIRDGHSQIVWIEGPDGDAGESYDQVANTVYHRIDRKSFLSRSAATELLTKYQQHIEAAS